MNGYVGFYKGKRAEVHASTMYAAEKLLAEKLKAKKSYDVSVVLAEVDGKEVVHKPDF